MRSAGFGHHPGMILKLVAGVAVTLALPSAALAAAPTAATGGAKQVTENSATLTGTVNPNSEATTYYFQYGTSKTYGSQTPTQGPTAAVKANQAASAAIGGLAANTSYHYRLVAVNGSGTKLGNDKQFKTQRAKAPAPAAATVTLGAAPARVVAGRPTKLSGHLTPAPGKSASGVKITLQANGKNVGTTNTDSSGNFTFTQSPTANTSYTAASGGNPKATSAPAAVKVAFSVSLRLSSSHPKRGKRVVFSGAVTPARNGALVRIQKRVGTRWRTVKSGVLTAGASPAQSAFRVAVRIRSKGVYRAFVLGDANNVAGASRTRLIRPHK